MRNLPKGEPAVKEQELISIIVPVYRAEKYLADCLNSLVNQEYQNIEIILVVDGSPDNSLAICREFASRDGRIRVVDQENQGVSAARNHGIELATGKYITFVDSDDYVALDYLNVLHRDLVEHDVDVACCDLVQMMNGKMLDNYPARIKTSRRIGTEEELFESLTQLEEPFWGNATLKLYKAEFVKQCRFKPLRYGEDHVFFFDLCMLKPRLYLNPYKGYYYIRNEDSATVSSGEYGLTKCWDEVQMDRYCYENFPGTHEFRGRFFMRYVYKMMRQVRITLLYGDDTVRKEQKPVLRKEIFSLLRTGEKMPVKSRVYFCLYLCVPGVLRKMLQAQNAQ